MGEKSPIPVLQMIFALLALSECLPISSGGAPAIKPLTGPTIQDVSKKRENTGKSFQELGRVWTDEELNRSEYLDRLPVNLRKDVREFLKTKSPAPLKGGRSVNSQENLQRGIMPSWRTKELPTEFFSLEDSNTENMAKLKTKTAKREKVEPDEGTFSAENVTIILMKNKEHRSKRFSRIKAGSFHNRLTPHLSDEPLDIAYTHVVPCVYADRFYCLNGGICVFVGALDIKTCRCPLGYTGLRCEMLDQEYILSVLTNSIMYD